MHNVGKIDRIIRISIAALLGILYFTQVVESKFFLFLAFMLVMTSLKRCCPIYSMVGLGTCGVKMDESKKTIDTEPLNLKK
ncbi:MAG: DUF2892 domain-containing protein [Prolixibacteraceae bacterium]